MERILDWFGFVMLYHAHAADRRSRIKRVFISAGPL